VQPSKSTKRIKLALHDLKGDVVLLADLVIRSSSYDLYLKIKMPVAMVVYIRART
jgi:hypothetical protein